MMASDPIDETMTGTACAEARDEPEPGAERIADLSGTPLAPLPAADGLAQWERMLRRVRVVLHEKDLDARWRDRFIETVRDMRELARRNVDLALYVLIHAAGHEVDFYSAQHAMACGVVSELAARWLGWSEQEIDTVGLAAMSMNVSMTAMHDALARQAAAPSAVQRDMIGAHAAASADLLAGAGVDDRQWLEAVRLHHTVGESAAADVADAGPRIAELLRRVDIYTAKLSRRSSRVPTSPALAARDACLGPQGHPDSIGATLLRVLGLYPPGTWVTLASGEIAIVVARGLKAHTPVVAAVRRGVGGLLMPPVRRDTALRSHQVRCGLGAHEVRVRLDHLRVLAA
jgi:hypothetical protein